MVGIPISKDVFLSSDVRQWILTIKNKTTYHETIEQVFSHLLRAKIKASSCNKVESLVVSVKSAENVCMKAVRALELNREVFK